MAVKPETSVKSTVTTRRSPALVVAWGRAAPLSWTPHWVQNLLSSRQRAWQAPQGMPSFVPHWVQNLASGLTDASQCVQFKVSCLFEGAQALGSRRPAGSFRRCQYTTGASGPSARSCRSA
ncbi:hypothetical protein D3C86_1704130 [compost metagenome]